MLNCSVYALDKGQKDHVTSKHHKIFFITVLCISETHQRRKKQKKLDLNLKSVEKVFQAMQIFVY